MVEQDHHHHHPGHTGCSGHHHDYSSMTDDRRLTFALAVIASFGVIEVIGGFLSGSLALLADAGHMAMDGFAIALALWARHLAKKPSTPELPFGRKRAQVLAAFVNGLALFVLIGILLWESIERISDPKEISGGIMMVIAILGLLANIVAFRILHSGDTHDVNMRGAILHVISDIMGSVAAIISAIIITTTGWVAVDAIVTLMVCILIARSAWHLVVETTHVLLQGAPPQFDSDTVQTQMSAEIPQLGKIHDMRVWMLTPDTPHLTMRAEVSDPSQTNAVLQQVKNLLSSRYNIEETTIQIEPIVSQGSRTNGSSKLGDSLSSRAETDQIFAAE